jgi:hypothetical protein
MRAKLLSDIDVTFHKFRGDDNELKVYLEVYCIIEISVSMALIVESAVLIDVLGV